MEGHIKTGLTVQWGGEFSNVYDKLTLASKLSTLFSRSTPCCGSGLFSAFDVNILDMTPSKNTEAASHSRYDGEERVQWLLSVSTIENQELFKLVTTVKGL